MRDRERRGALPVRVVVGAGIVGVLGACGDADSGRRSEPESTGSVRSAVFGGSLDPESAESNVVVRLSAGNATCSGTLISPRIVLTAGHCVNNKRSPGCPPVTFTTTVGSFPLPPGGGPSSPGFTSVGPGVAKLSGCYGFGVDDYIANGPIWRHDIALVYLSQAVVPSSVSAHGTATPPLIVRPSFNAPPRGNDEIFDVPVGVAGFSPRDEDEGEDDPGSLVGRHVRLMTDEEFVQRTSGPGGSIGYWSVGPHLDWGTNFGDSGGPLFGIRGDGSRDPFGVISGILPSPFCVDTEGGVLTPVTSVGSCYYFADITTSANKAWILDRVQNNNVPASLRPSTTWLNGHGKYFDSFWGETDYSGPCTTSTDRDCDGWCGAHA